MTKEIFNEVVRGKSVDSVEFTVFSPEQIARNSHVQLCNYKIYTPCENGRTPVKHGCLDTRLGVSVTKADCLTCNLDLANCVGHFGHIPLEHPCFHSGFIKKILQICQCICKKCGRLLMSESDKIKWTRRIEKTWSSALLFKATIKNIAAKVKNNKICKICNYQNGTVKKLSSIKLVHELPVTLPSITDEFGKKMKQTLSKNKNKIILNPDFVFDLFKKIPPEDYLFLGFRNENKPENLIFTQFPVPPACIRPSVASDSRLGSNEDDLSVKISEIIFKNESLRFDCMRGDRFGGIMNLWESLQVLICLYMIGDVKNVPPSQMVQGSIRSLLHRLKGKNGRFRANLSGKRVDFSARTVISPDPNISINQVVIPEEIAKILTFPEVVNRYNIEKIRAAILNGPDIHPGANYVQSLGVAYKRYLRYYNPVEAVKNLKIGDIVERHITDGDIVVFNRQPSLHRISMMGHVVKVMPHRTLRMNECVCTPYNADFDGDEMNIHVPQTYESKAETWVLMGVNQNIRTPRNGDPLISSIQDFITGSYLLTSKNNFFSYDQFSSLSFSFLNESNVKIPFKLPIPAILKPFPLWTGKQVISSMINPQANGELLINLRIPGKEYSGGEETCTNDSFVVFYNGLHLFGSIDKNSIGSGSKRTLFYAILKNFGPEKMSQIMSRLNRVSIHYLMMFGLSHSLDDVMASPMLSSETDVVIERGYRKCDDYAERAKTGLLEVQPGLTMNDTLENHVLNELSLIRDESGKLCVKKLPRNCTPLIMTLCGSKGSSINVCQMIACVGQQAIGGKRVVADCEGRTLPLFPKSTHTPDSRGFVRESFMKGLSLAAFFFHTMGGREGLVDTAVKTAETGYMQRRLIKCLEDLSVQYDNTVRNCNRQVVQFKFGGDGIDPIEMETMNSPVNFDALLNHLDCVEQHRGPTLKPEETAKFLDLYIKETHPTANNGFVAQIKSFVDSILRNNMVPISTDINTSERRKYRLTEGLLSSFVNACMKKYSRAYIEPGTTVGSLCAQSIGEPATQMTLKTFHFAGVASMNITQGVPRMKEIINCVLNIATPVIQAPVENEHDKEFVVKVKNRIEKTTMEKISSHITLMVGTDKCYIEIEIDLIRIFLLGLEIDIETVVAALKKSSRLKFDRNNIMTVGPSIIRLYSSSKVPKSTYFEMRSLELQLKRLVVKGYPNIHRVIVTKQDSKIADAIHSLIVEGTDLAKVMATRSVVSNKVRSNDILTVAQVLGVEAARQTLINELSFTVKSHSIDVDYRHFDILAELMCHTGQVLGMTRFGLSKMKDSVLMLASFEGTGDHLYDAAVHSIQDPVKGISESIIVGNPVPVGTGMFGLLHRPMHPFEKKETNATSMFETMYSSSNNE